MYDPPIDSSPDPEMLADDDRPAPDSGGVGWTIAAFTVALLFVMGLIGWGARGFMQYLQDRPPKIEPTLAVAAPANEAAPVPLPSVDLHRETPPFFCSDGQPVQVAPDYCPPAPEPVDPWVIQDEAAVSLYEAQARQAIDDLTRSFVLYGALIPQISRAADMEPFNEASFLNALAEAGEACDDGTAMVQGIWPPEAHPRLLDLQGRLLMSAVYCQRATRSFARAQASRLWIPIRDLNASPVMLRWEDNLGWAGDQVRR